MLIIRLEPRGYCQSLMVGCTAIVCLITDKLIYVANAGDSRCIVVKQDKVLDMSEDHKPEC